jgi:hypothetical protein
MDEIYDNVWEIISALDMRGVKIKDLEQYGITRSLFYKTLKHFNVNSKHLTGGSGTKFKYKMKYPLPPEEMKKRNGRLINDGRNPDEKRESIANITKTPFGRGSHTIVEQITVDDSQKLSGKPAEKQLKELRKFYK